MGGICRHCEEPRVGAKRRPMINSATKQSIGRRSKNKLLRAACHRARICATRWLAMAARPLLFCKLYESQDEARDHPQRADPPTIDGENIASRKTMIGNNRYGADAVRKVNTCRNGAGEGNRTLVFSLEGCCSTIELHPRAADELSRHGRGLNRHAPAQCLESEVRSTLPRQTAAVPASVLRTGAPLNRR